MLFRSYLLVMGLTPCVLLLLSLRTPGLRASNTLMLAGGMAVRLLTDLLYQLRLIPVPGYQLTATIMVLTAALFAWALLRGNVFSIVPVARHLVLESMADLVIVLNTQKQIVDANQAAKAACPAL